MPFDGVDFNQPCLRTLSAVLRDETKWPAGFYWDYRSHTTCAVGLGKRLWGFHEPSRRVPHRDMDLIFVQCGRAAGKWMDEVTPADVADAIDGYLATGAVDPVPPQYRAKRMFRDWFRRWFI
jgi:hypothetical protein